MMSLIIHLTNLLPVIWKWLTVHCVSKTLEELVDMVGAVHLIYSKILHRDISITLTYTICCSGEPGE